MKKTTLLPLALTAVLALATACNERGKSATDDGRDSLMQVIDQKDDEVNSLIDCINEIQEGFQRINEAEGRVTIASDNTESNSARETIRENMQFVQETMQKNRELIEQLQQKLRTSSSNVSALEKTLENFRQQLAEKDASIQELRAAIMDKDSLILRQTEQIDNLNNDVANLAEDNARKSETMATQDKELNKGWFVFGTKAELKEQRILTSGDVLTSSDFNKNYFTEVDIRTLKEINLYSKKAELLTSHPEGSYTLKKNQKGEYVLNVTNAKKFWSVSKVLVILVK